LTIAEPSLIGRRSGRSLEKYCSQEKITKYWLEIGKDRIREEDFVIRI
jgi:hypothetical protein